MSVFRRGAFAGLALLLVAVALLAIPGVRPVDVAAQIACDVEFSLPGGNAVRLQPGETHSFSYSVLVSASGVNAVDVEVTTQSIAGLIVAIQPSVTTVDGLQRDIPQAVPVFGRIVVTVPESAAPGTYTIAGVGAVATCYASSQNVDYQTTVRSNQTSIVVEVPEPEPTPTPSPTPVPIPPFCEPGISIIGDDVINASPGDRLVVPYEASVVVRRIFDVTVEVMAQDQGSIRVSFEPASGNFTFDPAPSSTTLRTFTGNIIIDIPQAQPPGTYGINGLMATALCYGLDTTDDVTTITGTSTNASLTIRLAVPPTATPPPTETPTPEPTSTATIEPSPTATATATVPPVAATSTSVPEPSPTATDSPTSTSTATAEASPTASSTPTPRSIVRTPVGTVTVEGEASVTPTETAEPPVSTPKLDGIGLLWNENRQAIEAEPVEESDWMRPLAGGLAALMIAGGGAGIWFTRGRG